MPTPKRKLSRSRIGMRSANKGLKAQLITLCSNKSCETPTAPHEVCVTCGFYRGKKVMTTKADRDLKRTTLRVAKKAKQAEAQAPQAQ